MSPPTTQNGRPQPRSDRPNTCTTSTSTSVTEHAAADTEAFRDAYRLGFGAGYEVGRMQLDYELSERDRLRMARMHDIATTPAYAELERIRWDGRREDFGRPRPADFKGFGADYAPSTAGRACAHRRVA